MIPEMVGRLPIITTLSALDEEALVEILTKPKNALVRQYQKLFEMEEADLKFKCKIGRVIHNLREFKHIFSASGEFRYINYLRLWVC